MSVNKVIIVGNVGQNPEVRYSPGGNAVANLSVATTEKWKDKQTGETKEKTEWHRVVIFGKLAEIAEKYVKKGSQIYIEGKLQTRKWQDQSGNDRYSTEVLVNGIGGTMQMLGGRQAGGSTPQGNVVQGNNNGWGLPQLPSAGSQFSGGTQKASSQAPSSNEPPMDFDDTIPF